MAEISLQKEENRAAREGWPIFYPERERSNPQPNGVGKEISEKKGPEHSTAKIEMR